MKPDRWAPRGGRPERGISSEGILIGVMLVVLLMVMIVVLKRVEWKRSPAPRTSVSSAATAPEYIKQIAVLNEGSHGLMVYFILATANGAMTRAPGTVTLKISESDGYVLYSTSFPVSDSDFRSTKVGLGAFEHEALLYPVGIIPFSSFSWVPDEATGKVVIEFSCQDGRVLRGEQVCYFK